MRVISKRKVKGGLVFWFEFRSKKSYRRYVQELEKCKVAVLPGGVKSYEQLLKKLKERYVEVEVMGEGLVRSYLSFGEMAEFVSCIAPFFTAVANFAKVLENSEAVEMITQVLLSE